MINIEGCSFDALAEGNRWKKKAFYYGCVSRGLGTIEFTNLIG